MGPPDARDAAAPDRWTTLIDGDGAVAAGRRWPAQSPARVVCPRAASRACVCVCGAALHCTHSSARRLRLRLRGS